MIDSNPLQSGETHFGRTVVQSRTLMCIIAEFSIPAAALPGGDALAECPNVRVEVERIIPAGERVLPFFWIWGPDPEAFLDRLGEDPAVSEIDVLEELDRGVLYRATWGPDATIIRGIEQLRATIVSGVGTDDGWTFAVRANDRSDVAQFRDTFRENDVPVRLDRIFDLSELVANEYYGLTAEQRETLVVACREGYFDDPRGVTQEELGDHFGITGRAISHRLRRGTERLVSNTLLQPVEPVDD